MNQLKKGIEEANQKIEAEKQNEKLEAYQEEIIEEANNMISEAFDRLNNLLIKQNEYHEYLDQAKSVDTNIDLKTAP